MLKRLELVGFKSFADKTIFDFPAGITAVVGPNGSGKSNIVDAVRWILGEQSAKSLRGGEMADVIFNGSATRRSLGLAEVTMTFDNARRSIALDADEVQITRRVYTTGEGEYLINNQMCRLRDIKELFLGSGAGHDAYCIIEQGKVDILLQASTRDRRVIFEEAAGISRFKAKKVETLRKLERVDQNLARVKDIIEEVEKQHRSVKLQAAKAQRYQEYSTRLKDLRLALGREEYRALSARLDAEGQALDGLRAELDQRAARAGACEAEAERLEMLLADLEDALRDVEARLAGGQQQIKAEQTTLVREEALTGDLESERAATQRRASEAEARVRGLAQAVETSRAELAEAETQAGQQREVAQRLGRDVEEAESLYQAAQEQQAADKALHMEEMRRAAHLQNEAVATRAHVDNLTREKTRLHNRGGQAAESLASLDQELEQLETGDQELQARLAAARQTLLEQRQAHEGRRQKNAALTARIAQRRESRSGLVSRIEVLEGLIQSHEGVDAGPRALLRLLEQAEPGPWQTVAGMLADFLTVKREHAHLIDVALGNWAQCFLVRDLDLLTQALATLPAPLPGRVSFFSLAPDKNRPSAFTLLKDNPQVSLSLISRLLQHDGRDAEDGEPAASAAQLVSCDSPDLTDLPEHLLGRTLIVRNLSAARRLAAAAPGFRFLTLEAELLEADGTLTVGAHHAAAGLISRNSELRDLEEQVRHLDFSLREDERALEELSRVLDDDDGRLIQEGQEALEGLAEQAAGCRARVQQHRQRRQGLALEVSLQQDEMNRLEQEILVLDAAWQRATEDAAQAEQKVQALHARIGLGEQDLARLDQERQAKQHVLTHGQVELAKVEERLDATLSRHRQQEHDLEQRQEELRSSCESLASCAQRLRDNQQTMLQASAALAVLYLEKEERQRQGAELTNQRESRRQERARLAQQAQAVRAEWRAQQEAFHQRELAANDLRHERQTLVDRLREDYQVDLAALDAAPPAALPSADAAHPAAAPSAAPLDPAPQEPPAAPDAPLDPAAVNEEIAELRRKLSRLGNVNMEALAELNELEGRAGTLKGQYDDLIAAKKSLEEIIGKINQDSRRLFSESFATIRTHFQELFRKLFGGGMADIVLEDENDVLESGVEVIARPPGKELRSISLMSGGEKTLTAVALLLAIFRSKPSPFCLLDEVDAALDEANIGRFTGVLREFLDLSQFIIVTHSKKTMAVADVLYGITMQESGISKQVAVRFEDWVDETAQAAAQPA